MATAPVLDFRTPETHHVRIDGTLYPLRSVEVMNLPQLKRLEADSPRLVALLALPEPSAEEWDELDRLLRSHAALLLDAPPDVLARLTDHHRLAIVGVFSELRAEERTPTGATTKPARSRRGSNGSTRAAIPSAG